MNERKEEILKVLKEKGPLTVPLLGPYISGTRSEIAKALQELKEEGKVAPEAQHKMYGGLYVWKIKEE